MRVIDLSAARELLVAPGVFDALSARVGAAAGFSALYMSGGSVSMSSLGLPDAELLGATDMAEELRRICSVSPVPVLADADTGFGNPMSARRAVMLYEGAGASGMHFEDQRSPKGCGHLLSNQLVDAESFAMKLRAAVDARSDQRFLIIARTDARRAEGMASVLERVRRYAAEGVDLIFAEALQSVEEVRQVHLASGLPLMVNQVPGGAAPVLPHQDLFDAGCRIVIYPSVLMSAAILAMESNADRLAAGSFEQLVSLPPVELFERVGLSKWLAEESSYATQSCPEAIGV